MLVFCGQNDLNVISFDKMSAPFTLPEKLSTAREQYAELKAENAELKAKTIELNDKVDILIQMMQQSLSVQLNTQPVPLPIAVRTTETPPVGSVTITNIGLEGLSMNDADVPVRKFSLSGVKDPTVIYQSPGKGGGSGKLVYYSPNRTSGLLVKRDLTPSQQTRSVVLTETDLNLLGYNAI